MAPTGVTRRRRETLARLLDAAADIFGERGFGAVSIEEICSAAGYSRGAFYSNFTSKDDLFFALFVRQSELMVERFRGVLDGTHTGDNPIEVLTTIVAAHNQWQRRWFLLTTEFTLYAVRNPGAGEQLREHEITMRARLTELLDTLLDATRWRCTITLDELARMLVALSDGLTAQSLVEPRPDEEGADRRILAALLAGVLEPEPEEAPAQAGSPVASTGADGTGAASEVRAKRV